MSAEMKSQSITRRVQLNLECLEDRCVPSAGPGGSASPPSAPHNVGPEQVGVLDAVGGQHPLETGPKPANQQTGNQQPSGNQSTSGGPAGAGDWPSARRCQQFNSCHHSDPCSHSNANRRPTVASARSGPGCTAGEQPSFIGTISTSFSANNVGNGAFNLGPDGHASPSTRFSNAKLECQQLGQFFQPGDRVFGSRRRIRQRLRVWQLQLIVHPHQQPAGARARRFWFRQ
jgi:hypothetical protein